VSGEESPVKGEERGVFMATKHVVLAGLDLPFTVESVSAERVQSWASFASQTTTKEAFSVVGRVFGAFWMEESAAYEFQQVLPWLYQGDAWGVVLWLDGVVSSLYFAAQRWQEVGEMISNDAQIRSWAGAWYNDAAARMQMLSHLQAQVVDWIIWCCEQVQWELPEETQKVLASRQQGGQ